MSRARIEFPFDPIYGRPVYHPWIVASFASYSSGYYMVLQSAMREIIFNSQVSWDNLRLRNDGSGNLAVSILDGGVVAESFTVWGFEDGTTITGIGYVGSRNFSFDAESEYTITQTPINQDSVGVNFETGGGISVPLSGLTVTYFFETMVVQGDSFNLRHGVPVIGGDDSESLMGFDVNDATGEAYSDNIEGHGGNDELFGLAGRDTLDGGDGADLIFGGEGNDTFVLRIDDAATAGPDNLAELNGEGTDTLRIVDVGPADLRFWVDGYTTWLEAPDGSGGHVVFARTTVYDNATGLADTAALFELVQFDDGTVWDLRDGLRLSGTDGGQRIVGVNTDDLVEGHGGNDELFGLAGRDTLDGGDGADLIFGGEGNDTFVLRIDDAATAGPDNLAELNGEGTDTLRIVGVGPADLRFWVDGYTAWLEAPDGSGGHVVFARTTVYDNATGLADTAALFELVQFDDGTVWDLRDGLRLSGTDADQNIFGVDTNDLIEGHGGRDALFGLGGKDTLEGGAGDDTVDGGGGNDRVVGGDDGDLLYGGAGKDTFAFGSADQIGFQTDVIGDFSRSKDRIDLSAFMAGGSYIGRADFTGAGQVRYQKSLGLLSGDVDGDGAADWELLLTGGPNMSADCLVF